MFYIFTVTSCILCIVLLYWGVPFLVKIIQKKLFLAKIGNSKATYLTFDDGPDPLSTPRILRLLKKYDARATFFTVGSKSLQYPELMKSIINAGHAVGEHGYKHIHPWKSGPLGSIIDIINNRKAFNSDLYPKGISLYRPPYGKYNIITLLYYSIMKNKKPVFWDIDAQDYDSNNNAEKIARDIMQQMKPGSVVLLHDGRQRITLSSVEVTINALEKILKTSANKGIQFRTIDDLFNI